MVVQVGERAIPAESAGNSAAAWHGAQFAVTRPDLGSRGPTSGHAAELNQQIERLVHDVYFMFSDLGAFKRFSQHYPSNRTR